MAKKLTEEEKKELERKKQAVLQTNNKIFEILFVEDELSWKTLIYNLVDEEQMDPWDIDVSILANKFLEMLKKLKELDFRISGKIVLAAAVLLKMKSDRLVDEDLTNFDNVMNNIEENLPLDDESRPRYDMSGKPQIYPKTPQPRKRKVSVFDLVKALEKALEVEHRRRPQPNMKKIEIKIPEKKFDLLHSTDSIFHKVESHYKSKKTKSKTLTFDDLVLGNNRQDKVLTFIPLLQLDTSRKVDLTQPVHFETISITLAKVDTKSEIEETKAEVKE